MEGALPRPIAHGATSTASGSPTWIDVIVRYLRSLSLSAADRARLETVQRAAGEIGAPLLAATSVNDLDERLDAAAMAPELARFNTSAGRTIELPASARVASYVASPTPVFEDVLGLTAARVFADGLRLLGIVVSVAAQLFAEPSQDALAEPTDVDPRSLFAVRGMPAAILEAILDGLKAEAALLAVAHASLSRAPIEPWLAMALAERFRDSMRSHVRFLAGLPVNVPESLVRKEERLDVMRLVRDAEEAEARIDQLADRAMATPEGVVWSGDQAFQPVLPIPSPVVRHRSLW